MDVVRVVLDVLLALLLVGTGGGKIAGAASSHQIRDSLLIPPVVWRLIGVFELVLAIGLVWGIWARPVGVVSGIGVVVLMLGAILGRVRAGGDQRRTGIPADVVVALLAVLSVVLTATS